MKKFLSVLLILNVFSINGFGASGVSEDESAYVSHLPRKLRSPALRFYEVFENTCRAFFRVAEGTSLLDRRKNIGFIQYYADGRWAAPRNDSVIKYIDYLIFEDGIGREKDEKQSANLYKEIYDLDKQDFDRDDVLYSVPVEFITMLSELADNPFAMHIKALLYYHGFGVRKDTEVSKLLLRRAGGEHYKRSLNFLNVIGLASGQEKELLALLNDPLRKMKKILDGRDNASDPIEDMSFLESTLDMLPGETVRYVRFYKDLQPRMKTLLEPFESISMQEVFNWFDLAVYTTGAVGGTIWSTIDEGAPEPVVFTIGSSIFLIKTLTVMVKDKSIFRIFPGNCCGRFKRYSISKEDMRREAKLSALYLILRYASEINKMEETVDSLAFTRAGEALEESLERSTLRESMSFARVLKDALN